MRLSDFDFELPDELIAQHPLGDRLASRLLVYKQNQQIKDQVFGNLVQQLNAGDLLVVNNTKVIPARLFGYKSTGGAIEVLIERVIDKQHALAHIRASKSPREGTQLILYGCQVTVIRREESLYKLVLSSDDWFSLMSEHGHIPLPPYIEREDNQEDQQRYQTVYAAEEGAIAAPTAGLHFDQALLDTLKQLGVNQAEVTLHVGAGTFQPVRTENLEEHVMHFERVQVTQKTVDSINSTKAAGGKIVAVGTTVVRSLESAAQTGELKPYNDETNLFIRPGYDFKVVDRLITNFHLPKSTLLMLVSAFSGVDEIKEIYQHAISNRYRFFSYGDAMILDKKHA